MFILFVSASSLANDRMRDRVSERIALAASADTAIIAIDRTIPTAVAALLAPGSPLLDIPALLAARDPFIDPDATRKPLIALTGTLPALSTVRCSAEDAVALAWRAEADFEVLTGSNGTFQCDPEVVPEAKELPDLSFEEAAELSPFSGSGLDSSIIGPIARFRQPATIHPVGDGFGEIPPGGTRISGAPDLKTGPVKAIAAQRNISMLAVSGTCLPGTVGIAARVFASVGAAGVSVLLISQASSEYSICFCVRSIDERAAIAAIESEFAHELSAKALDSVVVIENLSILTLIGDGMRKTKGISGRCFTQLARTDVNIVAIAQGSSERSISAVILGEKVDRALRMIYQAFFDSSMPIDLVVVGCGNVGSALLAQIASQSERLEGHGVGARLVAVANSRRMIIGRAGLDPAEWRSELKLSGRALVIEELAALGPELLNPVLVDCTASDAIPGRYPEFMLAGFHVVTPNKRGNTGSMDRYLALKQLSIRHRRRYLYETTVGAGLPVIENLQNLLHAGDRLVSFSGILSGSLSFLFGRLEEGASFSSIVREAMAKGLTEPDPRDDLSGTDVARKVLIIARESGLVMELGDIRLEGLVPAEFLAIGKDEFIARLAELDGHFEEMRVKAAADGKALRFVGSIESGRGRVGLQAVGPEHPLFAVKGGENALAFTTRFYNPVPLLLRGYGAGAEVTAAGVFADILRTLNWIREA